MKKRMKPRPFASKLCIPFVKIMLLMLALMVVFLPEGGWADECGWCKRTLVVQAFSVTEPSFTTDAVYAWPAPILSGPCVTVKPFGTDPKAEYLLYARFETGQEGRFPKFDGTYPSDWIPDTSGTRSILSIALWGAFGDLKGRLGPNFQVGGLHIPHYGCFLEGWDTRDEGLSWQGHQNMMGKEIRSILPLEKFLRVKENAPVKVEIQPQKEDLDPGEEIKIRLTGFKDKDGKPMNTACNPNRILFKVEKGEIIYKEVPSTAEDPRLNPYPVAPIAWDKEYIIKYKAPNGSCTEDTILVYNSCDILDYVIPVLPWEETHKKDLIGKKKIRIGCYDATLRFRGRYFLEEIHHQEKKSAGSYEELKFHGTKTMEGVIYVPLALDSSHDVPYLNQRWEYYRPLNIHISSFNAIFVKDNYYFRESSGFGSRTRHVVRGTGTDWKLDEELKAFTGAQIMVVFNRKTGKALNIVTGGYGINFGWSISDELHGEVWTPDSKQKDDKSDSRKEEARFEVTPVGEKIPDPALSKSEFEEGMKDFMKEMGMSLPPELAKQLTPEIGKKDAEIQSDLLVKFGDGVMQFGGEAKKVNDKSESGTKRHEESHFWWEMAKKKK